MNWVVLLQAVATYAALGSAACFAVPLFRSAAKAYSRDILQQVQTPDPRLKELVQNGVAALNAHLTSRSKANVRWNAAGVALIVISVATYTAAFFV